MNTPVQVRHSRRILCVSPRYAPSFGTFQYAYPLMDGVRAFMPPQGILAVAAYLPPKWEVRIVDENIRPASAEEIAWADAVFVSGMHVQKGEIKTVASRARAAGKTTVLGGPSVSASPEQYPEFDYLHIGELGDATDALICAIDEDATPPAAQQRFTTQERLPLADFPIPFYRLIDGGRYFIGSVQFSSGCPYRCEFCDIPALYGRQPRLKTPQQILAELDALLAAGIKTSIYFVDDNFIGNKKAARELLPHLVDWQKRRGYPVQLCCEATLNIAKSPDILALMREAYFCTVFCGIESPELAALDAMQKSQNRAVPLLDAVATINSYGIEVVSGIILGLDTDTPQTADRLIEFIDRSQIPMLTINLLQALPKTPLWERLQAAGRISRDARRESNVVFARPYDEVLQNWHRAVRHAYTPQAIYRRFAWNAAHTYANRITPPLSRARLTPGNLRRALIITARLILRVGLFGDYRRIFWQMAWPALRAGRIEELIHIGIVAHHMILFARGCAEGRENAAFFTQRPNPPTGEARADRRSFLGRPARLLGHQTAIRRRE
ncbi:MAG: B12-binding domain-containing radical SAM protein [Alphaproteobacteria bacterium]|nr:B12-binding domain-containing radical SAM protein [Alphaproteobacteria bacterium]